VLLGEEFDEAINVTLGLVSEEQDTDGDQRVGEQRADGHHFYQVPQADQQGKQSCKESGDDTSHYRSFCVRTDVGQKSGVQNRCRKLKLQIAAIPCCNNAYPAGGTRLRAVNPSALLAFWTFDSRQPETGNTAEAAAGVRARSKQLCAI